MAGGKAHAMRTSVRPEGRRRETLCGALVTPLAGQYFTPVHPHACKVCSRVVETTPLRYGISSSNELSRLRALLDEVSERRVEPSAALAWVHANGPHQLSVGGATGTGTNTCSR